MTANAFAPTNYWPDVVATLEAQLVQPRTVGTGKLEYFIVCPNCGATGRKFSISERGCHCFVCGWNPSHHTILERLGGQHKEGTPQPKPAIERKPRPWQARANIIAADLAATPGTVQAWQKYKPVSTANIARHQLGYGVFPGGLWDSTHERRCNHPRLIVPLFDGGQVVGFRCRAIDCSCTKWLSPGGSRLTLYGNIKADCDVLSICENPIDAILVRQEWEGVAVATLGVSIWRDEYTEAVKAANAKDYVVFFDNDAPGQTTNPSIITEWGRKHPSIEPPLCGIKLTNRLLQAGLPATFYRWPNDAEAGADIGGFFK